MRFWDSSAIVPLVIQEAATDPIRQLLSQDPQMATWALTATEIVSALWRRKRLGELTIEGVQQATWELDQLAQSWTRMIDLDRVLDRRVVEVQRLPLQQK